MRRFVVGLWFIVWVMGAAAAQDGALTAQDITVVAGTDAFGQSIQIAEGQLLNQGDTAYNNISLQAEAYDAGGNIVGEGLGYLVNACGAGLLPDYALQPGQAQPFQVPLELYEADTAIDHVDITADASPVEAEAAEPPPLLNGITQASNREVVSVEWIDPQQLRFGVGCPRDLFTKWTWFQYNVATGVQQAIQHPKADIVNNASGAMLTQLELAEPIDLARSGISFEPNGRRMVYQNDRNSVLSAEPDGSFRRLLADRLFNRTLQGIYWLEDGNFLAYYYGAYGDPVLYFTANAEGQRISEHPVDGTPSIIVPGAAPDGSRVIIAATINDITGYYLKQAPYPDTEELLFQAEPPGNNWPAPIYMRPPDASPRVLYIARPVDEQPMLQCFNLTTRQLRDLTPLPLQLATDERAMMWLSPDRQRIALAATGLHGGLWMIDLTAFGSCQ